MLQNAWNLTECSCARGPVEPSGHMDRSACCIAAKCPASRVGVGHLVINMTLFRWSISKFVMYICVTHYYLHLFTGFDCMYRYTE